MAGSQLGKLLGISEDADEFFTEVWQVLTHLGDLQGPTADAGARHTGRTADRQPTSSRAHP